jgi:hypothetical protein
VAGRDKDVSESPPTLATASANQDAGHCLNCRAPLAGAFCAECGQRVVPPNPTVRELAGDAWHELSGYDGRVMQTIRGLARPGFLTQQYVDGRRTRYLPPIRLYLIVSVAYFLIAASAPEEVTMRESSTISGPGGMQIDVSADDGSPAISAEERAELVKSADEAHWLFQPMLRSVAEDPDAFRARMFTIMPRVFFAMLPVFAGVVALFYRKCHFPTALVFAVHLHAFAFIVFAVAEAVKFTGNAHLADRVSGLMAVVFGIYALMAFRRVFGGRWPITIVKAAAIGFAYLVAAVPAFIIIMLWASWA